VIFSSLVLTRIINAYWMPPAQDEVYYFLWARHLAAGFFDHPPMVAFLASLGNLHIGSALLSRTGTLLLSFLALPFLLNLFRRLGAQEGKQLFHSMILASLSAAAVVQGYITTPDIPMLFCWILALHEAAAALDGKPKRWLSAGFFTGLGLMGKYTMALIGPVFLIALLVRPKKLLQPWPYLGGLVCVLTLLPHLLWLQSNDWITLRFQFGRGFMSVYNVDMKTGTDLPWAVEPAKDGEESQLAKFFTIPDDEVSPPKKAVPQWQKYLNNFGSYVGGQLGLWGLLLFPMLAAIIRRRQQPATWRSPELKALAWAACFVPLGLFALLSPFQFIEANWPAMYMIGGSILFTQYFRLHEKYLLGAAALNLCVTLLLTLHHHVPILSTKPHKDRLLKESHGYQQLAIYLQHLSAPVLIDTYQNSSQMAFYAPSLKIQQWPGVARTSELIRNEKMNPWRWEDLQKAGAFYLLTDNFIPPHIPGARIYELSEILDCVDDGLKITLSQADGIYFRPCLKRVHRWSLAYYKVGM